MPFPEEYSSDLPLKILESWSDWEKEFETGIEQPPLDQAQSGTGRKRSAEDDVETPATKKTRRECDTCGKVFFRPDKLKRHEQTHVNDRQHKCSKCDKKFQRKSHLQRHEKQVHEKRAAVREYRCNTCGEQFRKTGPIPCSSVHCSR
ncbi:hypothetical protein OS493_022000 [Desmophyllum pertusum]|uniref:C2H2-type domain-containing protein n=1 Tax=Desmophyllum pertusum TaxID=174260 RepID=A0A9W9Z1E1_9CNID|nr:hypothetical protein OS493_022000 [Desmophyllum pertusum]